MRFLVQHVAGAAAGTMLCAATLGAAHAQDITPAPAFTPEQLLERPGGDWITNGGNIFNQRYSTLTEINRDTIANLKGVWKTSLNGSGAGPGYSGEAQALEHDGVLYIVTGADDVFAVDVETGTILWSYVPALDLAKFTICCGWLSRGVGLGDGKVFVGQLDGTLVALDQTTGEKVWQTTVDDWRLGYSLTSAPLYYDGMVITGVAGGENGIRGHVSAYDAKTGEQVWRFYTIPGPGELGHETWPQDNDAWMYGGAPVWQTPSVDPELGLIYFSTGNPGPDLNGAIRAGDNLFSVSIVALDVKTGAYRWHFQQVRHDIWDYDSPNPTILFDAEIDGVLRKGIAQVSKSGYLYILDRTDGSPLTPIIDTPVPQEPAQATAATQPIPQGDWVTKHELESVGEEYEGILPNRGRTFTPFGPEGGAYAPGTGTNWIPSSYNPENHLMYICSNESAGGAFGGDADAMIGPGAPGQAYYQGGFRGPAGVGGARRTFLVAMDLRDHSRLWRREMTGGCSGSITTAGGLIFVGRNDGRITAMNSDTGQRIWEYRVDAGVFTTATTFEHEGSQYVAFLAGGSLLAGRQGDSLWLMSLNGTMEPLPSPEPAMPAAAAGGPVLQAAAVGAATTFGPPPAVPPGRVADLASGAEIFNTVCKACHGETGEGAHEMGSPLAASLTVDAVMYTAAMGRPGTNMQSFRNVYTAEQLHDVASYVKEVVLVGRTE
jgi:alcohol dehydrogenase (cytochrome c)